MKRGEQIMTSSTPSPNGGAAKAERILQKVERARANLDQESNRWDATDIMLGKPSTRIPPGRRPGGTATHKELPVVRRPQIITGPRTAQSNPGPISHFGTCLSGRWCSLRTAV